jgi:serine/threonine-protein kinase
MRPKTLKKASATPAPSLASASVSGLPPDLLREAATRLGWAGLIYSVTFFFASFGAHLFGGTALMPEHSIWERGLQIWVSFASIAMGLAVFVFARYSRLRPQLLLDIGLVFEVVGAFGISMSSFWGIFPVWDPAILEGFFGIPWECVWIVFFPILAPNTPVKTLLASIAAASTGFLTVFLSTAAGATSPDVPVLVFVLYFGFSTYICAGIAFFVSRTIYKFGHRLKKAREVGSYQLVKPLGEGGMGEVWLAKHRMLARPAAVKLIRSEALGPDKAACMTVCRRFEREARATATLGSQHTITLYDFGITQEGAFYYVMELLKGLNLDALVRRFGPIAPERAVDLLRQACHSLVEAHDRGMIHRDIKPANIYACHLGPDYDFVKVLDFGLVKSIGKVEVGAAELTAEGIATGTPAFMAPEMALGKQDLDGRVDIYCLGCVGYWLLTGQPVFESDTPMAMVVAHVQEKPVPPSQRTEREIPESVERVILKCLEKDPADRPQTADELSALLADCAFDESWTQKRAAEWWRLHLPDSELPGVGVTDQDMAQGILTVDR